MKHLDIYVEGKVQGVGFRYSAFNMAQKIGIKGFVKNLPDRRVYIEAEGDDVALEMFVKWCKDGPIRSRVDSCKVNESNLCHFDRFRIE
jgi:acylphosphatase